MEEKKLLEVGDLIKRVTPYNKTLIKIVRVTKTEAIAQGVYEDEEGKLCFHDYQMRYKREYNTGKDNQIYLTVVPYTWTPLIEYYFISNE